MSDFQRALRNILVGGALVLFSGYMLLYVGRLKKVYTDWNENPRHGVAGENTAAQLWPSIEACQEAHPFLWEIAPYFPPYFDWLNPNAQFSSFFEQRNWRFLVWLLLLVGSGGAVNSGFQLMRLVEQLDHEDRLQEMRIKRGKVTASGSGPTLIDIRNEIEIRAAETGKWWGLNGVIIGGAIATILGGAVLKWLGWS
jgi:hypothetical protein